MNFLTTNSLSKKTFTSNDNQENSVRYGVLDELEAKWWGRNVKTTQKQVAFWKKQEKNLILN